MKFSSLALATAVSAASSTTDVSAWTTLTPPGTAPPHALTKLTSSFGIAVSQITDSAELASISSFESELLHPTTTLSSASSSEYESSSSASESESSSYSSESAEATLDITSYLTLVSPKSSSALAMTLEDGILIDSAGRIGSIVANRQFQFDGPPPQAGAIYANGWSITENGTLAIGDQDVFFQCLSGTFYNLYDESIGGQCVAIKLQTVQFIDA